MKLPKLSIENHQFTLIIVLLFSLSGIVSFLTMPRMEDPATTPSGTNVVVVYPGAAPKDMEQLITDPIEDKINEIDNIKKINSTITDGLSVTAVEFHAGTDMDETYAKIVRKINSIRGDLPEDIADLDIRRWVMSDFVIVLQLALTSEDIDFTVMDDELDRLDKLLKKIPGVKKIKKRALPDREIRISIDPHKLALNEISLTTVMGIVKGNNLNIPGGSMDIGNKRFNIKTTGSYQSLEDVKNVIIQSKNGEILYLKNIADVRFDFEDNEYLARVNGQNAVYLTIHQKEGTNIFDVLEVVKKKVTEYEKELPAGVELVYVFDQSESVAERLDGFFINLIQGLLLVGIVVLLIVGFRESFIVMLAIPISVFISIGFIDLCGFGLEQMSIAGLVISLGLLVDNAIVVTENIARFIKKGENMVQAAIHGTSQIAWAVASSTATTVFAFIPIIMIQDVTGEYIRSMPLTVVFTLISSLLIALTFTPYLSSKFLKGTKSAKATFIHRGMDRLITGKYDKTLKWSIENPKKVISLAFIMFLFSLSLTPFVGISFFPKAEKPQFIIDINAPEGSGLDRVDSVARFVESELDKLDDVRLYASNIGKGNPQIHYNVRSPEKTINKAQIMVSMKKNDQKGTRRVISLLREKFDLYSGAKIEVKEIEQGPPVEAPIAIKIIGDNMDVLKELSLKTEEIFNSVDGVININNPQSISKTDIVVQVNRDKAAILGVPLQDIDRTVRACLAGASVSEYRDNDGEEYDIVVRLPFKDKLTIEDFNEIFIPSVTGKQIPLKQLATIEFETSPKEIAHYNFERNVMVTADVLPGVNIAQATNQITEKMKRLSFPNGYRYYVAGEMETTQESFGGMGKAALIALIAIFAVLVLQFKSFSQPLIVFTAIPLAIIGSIFTLLMTNNTFSFTAFIGLTSLLGIVINNSIILVDYTNYLIRKKKMDLKKAIVEAAEVRFTPIVLTTLTTIGGLLPLTLGGGSMWAPMGWTIIGGLAFSTFLTLIVVPILYEVFTKK